MATPHRSGVSDGGFDPFSPTLITDPFPQYHALRVEEPISWNTTFQAWVMTRMADVHAVLADPSFQAIETGAILGEIAKRTNRDFSTLTDFLDAALFFKNGPEHQRDRRTLAKIMNRHKLSHLRTHLQEMAQELVDRLANQASYDAVTAFADPFPQMVMAYIIGLPPEDVPILSELLAELTLVFDPAALATLDAINIKATKAFDLLMARIAAAPPGSGLRIIYEAIDEGDEQARLRGAAATALFTLRVGAETTIGLLGLLIREIVDHPELRDRIAGDAEASSRLVAEVLRLQSNVQRAGRVATERREIDGKTIEPGERLLLLMGAANRDPVVFPDPDQVRLDDDRAEDVAFGVGAHFCLGASLARLEGEITVAIFSAMPPLERAGDDVWYTGRTIRRLTSLPVRVAQ